MSASLAVRTWWAMQVIKIGVTKMKIIENTSTK